MLILVLSAVLDDGMRVEAKASGFTERPPVSLGAVREVLDTGFGRLNEPRPSPTRWASLVEALAEAGVVVTESELQPFPVRLRVVGSARSLVGPD
jgi:hypothetical protein